MSSNDTKLTAADSSESSESSGGTRAVLVLYESGEAGASTRVVEIFDGAQLTIGRSKAATILVDSERVSRIHARITRRGATITVEDAGSRNGTFVNGEVVTGARTLASGDEIVVGPATAVVTLTTRVVSNPHLESSRRLEIALAAEVDRGKRFQRVFSLLMVRIDGDVAEVDAAIDRLASRLRPMDLIAEYAQSELALVLPELDVATVDGFARELVAAARSRDGEDAPVVVTAGLAAFPTHGTTPGALLSRARAAVASVHDRKLGGIGTPPKEDPRASRDDAVVEDPQMRRVYELVRKVAGHPITVLVCGETGVGKEVVAAAIHQASSRSGGPLVQLNCASLPETLLESTLFGHEKGAFTGADRRAQGYFEAAHEGTLFLDEIGELSASTQAKLLRVLEESRFTRVGGTQEIEVDVRVVCATNRDLDAEVQRGSFRSDLFFRISAFTILIPPLRDRTLEVLPLAAHFIQRATHGRRAPVLAPSAAAALRAYAWPGNVRELRNAIERAVVLHSRGVIELEDLPDRVRDHDALASSLGTPPFAGNDVREQVAEHEKAAIVAALQSCGGNQTDAAKRLGITRRTLIYRMEKHGLKAPPASRG